MAEWKKVVVSGSDISQLNNDAGYLTNASVGIPNGYATASFNGSDLLANSTVGTLNFASESGEGLNITANTGTRTLTLGLDSIPNTSLANSTISGIALGSDLANLTIGNGLASSAAYNGGTARTVAVGQGTHITVNTNDVAVNTTTLIPAISGSIIDTIAGDVNVNAGGVSTIADSATGSILNTIAGDVNVSIGGVSTIQANAVEGTMLNTNVADTSTIEVSSNTLSVLKVPNALTAGNGLSSNNGTFDGSGAATFTVDYGSNANEAVQGNTNITINGTSNEIVISDTAAQALGGGPSYTIELADTIDGNRTFSGDTITINKDLIVQGTASFQSTENLQVADQFILLNSGSSTDNSPGGFVIQQDTQDEGVLFGYDAAAAANAGRFGVTSSFAADSSTFTADAYIAMVIDEDASQTDIALYQQRGNLKIDTSDDIWIYV